VGDLGIEIICPACNSYFVKVDKKTGQEVWRPITDLEKESLIEKADNGKFLLMRDICPDCRRKITKGGN